MPLKPRLLITVLLGSLASAAVLAQSTAATAPATTPASTSTSKKDDPRAAIVKKIDGLKLEDVRLTPINGVFEITRGAAISYVSSDGRYVIMGADADMYDIDTDTNLTENRRRGLRNGMLGAIPESEMIVFSPKDPKYTITVFTDIDCGYCRRLHSQIAEYNKLGIRVRYLFYPRSGPDTESWHKAEQVWCSANRNEALTRAKRDEPINAPKCPADVIARDWELGHKLAVEGTPSIVLPSGEMLGGYAPPAQLAKYLKTGKM